MRSRNAHRQPLTWTEIHRGVSTAHPALVGRQHDTGGFAPPQARPPGLAPPMAAATASAFPDPDTTSHTSRDRWAAGNVSVMRRGGGLGESGTPTTCRLASRTAGAQASGQSPFKPLRTRSRQAHQANCLTRYVAGAKADRNRGPVGAGEQLEDAVQAELVADLECDRPAVQVDPVDGGGAGLVGL